MQEEEEGVVQRVETMSRQWKSYSRPLDDGDLVSLDDNRIGSNLTYNIAFSHVLVTQALLHEEEHPKHFFVLYPVSVRIPLRIASPCHASERLTARNHLLPLDNVQKCRLCLYKHRNDNSDLHGEKTS